MKDVKEIVRGGVSVVGEGFDVTNFETGGTSPGDVAAAIAGATLYGLTSDVTAVEELEFEISEYDGKPGRTMHDSSPRKANLTVSFNLKQMNGELLGNVYATLANEAGEPVGFDKVTRELDPDKYNYQDNVFFIGLRKDKKYFILVIDKAASESPLDLSFTDGEDVTHMVEFMANYDMTNIRANIDRTLTAPYKLYIGQTT